MRGRAYALLFEVGRPLGNDEARARLGLEVGAADVLADDTERDELYAAEKEHDDRHGSPAGDGAAHRVADKSPDDEGKCHERHKKPESCDKADGLDGEARDAANGQAEHF